MSAPPGLNGSDHQPFDVTFFSSFAADRKREARHTLGSLADEIRVATAPEKSKLPWLKLAKFGDQRSDKNSLRHDPNVLEVTGIEADYDGEVIPYDEAVETLTKAGISGIVYTSPSHTPERPRWRVVCPLLEPVTPERRAKMLGRLNGLFRGALSGESWTLSQSYYYGSVAHNPAHQVDVVDGEPIDTLDDLDRIWQGKPHTASTANGSAAGRSGPVDEAALLAEIVSGRSYHASAVRLLGKWARDGVSYMDARKRLIEAMESVFPPDRDARWQARRDDVDRCLEGIYGKDAAARDAEEQTAPPPEDKRSTPWVTYTPAQCEDSPPRRYIIKGLIAEGDHAGIIGQPGSGKSLLGPALGYAVAQGRSIFGRRVRQGPVLYLAAEDGHGLRQRTRALCRRHGDAPDFHVLPESPDLLDPDSADHKRLKEVIDRVRPCLILIDTVARSFPGLRENEADGMNRVVNVARDLTKLITPPPAVITVHHVAKDAGTTPRGHGGLFGDQDVCLFVEGSGGMPRNVSLPKNRNGPSDVTFSFTVATEHLGEDEDGDAVLAPLAVEPADAGASFHDRAKEAQLKQREARLKDRPAMMMRDLRDVLAQHGELIQPADGYPLVRCVTRNILRARLVDRGWFAESMLCSSSDGQGLSNAGHSHESNALISLKRAGFVSFNRLWVWCL